MAMRDPVLKLGDKTIAVLGSFGSMVQMIMTVLTEQGANVALIGNESHEARRVTENLNDQRELYSHYGRATHVISGLNDEKEMNEAILRVVESFGRLDGLVDASLCEGRSPESILQMANLAQKFLTSRPKGRMVFLHFSESLGPTIEGLSSPGELAQFRAEAQRLTDIQRSKLLTCNLVSLGLTEEYLLKSFPRSPSIRMAFDEFQKANGERSLVEPLDIANCVMFLVSPLSQAINRQQLSLG